MKLPRDASVIEFNEDAPRCVTYLYSIDRRTEKLSGRRLKETPIDPDCGIVKLNADLKLSFVGGSGVERRLLSETFPMGSIVAAAILWAMFIIIWLVSVLRRRSSILEARPYRPMRTNSSR